MEPFFFLLALVLIFGPIVLSIIALVLASRASTAVGNIEREVRRLAKRLPAPEAPPVGAPAPMPPRPPAPPSEPRPAPAPAAPSAVARVEGPAPGVAPRPPVPRAAEPAGKAAPSLELQLGGKAASFVGIAALVVGVAFFVGYAIQHDWIGPGTRIVLGLVCGGVLVALGHFAETRKQPLPVLARALTGGGAALFYFCVFAAYGIYHLVPAWLAVAGLVFSAGCVLGLAAVYDSQAVGLLGLVGAYVTPVLIGGEFDRGVFPLLFVAIVNGPVLLLGLKRRWQALYNAAFVFTVVLAAAWLLREVRGPQTRAWITALCFVMVFFSEFVALGLLKLRGERAVTGRTLDVARLALSSLALLGAVYRILNVVRLDDWVGGAFLVLALVHIGLARAGWRWWPRFTDEILTLLVGALTFASLALPAQLDGVWVSLGWSIEGALLCWFALRVGSPPLQAGAIGLGCLGLMKSAVYDAHLYAAAPRPFLNGRFAVGLLSAALLGAQSWLHGRSRQRGGPGAGWRGGDMLVAALLGFLIVVFSDAFFTMGMDDPWACFLTTLALLGVGMGATLAARHAPQGLLYVVGVLVLFAVPAKLIVFDTQEAWRVYARDYAAFRNGIFWCYLLVFVLLALHVRVLSGDEEPAPGRRFTLGNALSTCALLAGILVVTGEISRTSTPWAMSLVTLWWAACALAMALTGLLRRRAYLRYVALVVFGATVIKVFSVDLGGLKGLQRAGAFAGVGLLLLLLSLAYQRIAPLLLGKGKEREGGAP